jgi:ATP-dependent DNA helicase RecG
MHQLRGRVGRGEHDSTCILMSDTTNPETIDRLSAFTSLESGFDVAEKDLSLRGPGDLIGRRQSGVPLLRIGDLIRDIAVLEKAREHAFEIIEKDNNLIHPENQLLRKELTRRFLKFQS